MGRWTRLARIASCLFVAGWMLSCAGDSDSGGDETTSPTSTAGTGGNATEPPPFATNPTGGMSIAPSSRVDAGPPPG
ncbi:MAG: hypothetical protein VX589_00015, partial [Myxococcota bacterium]|nr:hypothetical protein [Myxococcota bacterium]